MSDKFIHIKGARVNNLKNIEVKIKHNSFTVITGLSGSGKSSLAFDTLYAEGQRRYVESLSSYARQFLGRLDKPDTDFIKGISPAIAIEQKVTSTNPRSTVGTSTEIYDYLKVLFSRIGKTISPISGNEVKKHTVDDVITKINELDNGTKLFIVSPITTFEKYGVEKQIELLKEQGYSRVLINGTTFDLADLVPSTPKIKGAKIIIDRITSPITEESIARTSESISLAFSEGNGTCELFLPSINEFYHFNTKFELDGLEFIEPTEQFFTFNNPYGACKKCEGFGSILGINPSLVIPDTSLSIYQGAIACWKGDTMGEYLKDLLFNAPKFNFPIHRPYNELTVEEQQVIWDGNKYFMGLNDFFKFLESQSYKIQYRVLLSRYRGKTICPECKGTRIRKDANYVKLGGASITEIVLLPIHKCRSFFENLQLSEHDFKIASRILLEIKNRLSFLCDVGLEYLTLNRTSNTLSGGESQRINLATSLGSSLVGSMYILDEPSIGLHPKDTEQLIKVLKNLRDQGNTVIVVEHDEEIMKEADEIIDIGPMAGNYGGEIVFQGTHKDLINQTKSLTANYLTNERIIPIPNNKRNSQHWIHLKNVRQNNLNGLNISLPLYNFTCITGVSGSGKSTLIKQVLYPFLKKHLGISNDQQGAFDSISGNLESIKSVEFIDQNPIGKSSRSNPATYVGAFDDIRDLFSRQAESKSKGYKPGFFSFNVEGGRCEMCEGEGTTTVSMQFMADIHLLCEECEGKRYKTSALSVKYHQKNISDILEMDISEALDFFKTYSGRLEEKIVSKIQPLEDVGLGYLKLGQSSSTMSGGEAQRIKLASFLSKGTNAKDTLFIFDEPTTGLHFYDIEKLLIAIQRLIDAKNSVFIIEHHSDVIKCADWVVDLGPYGGDKGGELIFSGTPEQLIHEEKSLTGFYLKDKF
jgi:excinuclease ABC subunit A